MLSFITKNQNLKTNVILILEARKGFPGRSTRTKKR
jgi:hypothetical protein